MTRALRCNRALAPLCALGLVWGQGMAQNTAAASAPASASPGSAHIQFTYDNPQLQPAKYTITVNEDGSGHFHSETGAAPAVAPGASVSGQDRDIHIAEGMRQTLFATARQRRFFAGPCDGGGKIAFQGRKTLSYQGPDGHGSCEYNWSKDQHIERLTDYFESVAATLEEGRRLQVEYDHGRLELDMELDQLSEMAKDGRARELENIAPILETVVRDDAILKRAQRKAQMLLDQAKRDSASK